MRFHPRFTAISKNRITTVSDQPFQNSPFTVNNLYLITYIETLPIIYLSSGVSLHFQRQLSCLHPFGFGFEHQIARLSSTLYNSCQLTTESMHTGQMEKIEAGCIAIGSSTETSRSFTVKETRRSSAGQRLPSLSTTRTVI